MLFRSQRKPLKAARPQRSQTPIPTGRCEDKGLHPSTAPAPTIPPPRLPPTAARPLKQPCLKQHCLDVQAEDRLTPRSHVGHPFRKASWESLVGKPRGKDTDPLSHAKGSATLLLQLERKAPGHPALETRTDSPGETPEVPQDPCQHWRGILRFRHRIHTKSLAPASMGEESRESPKQLAWGLAFPEATRAGP